MSFFFTLHLFISESYNRSWLRDVAVSLGRETVCRILIVLCEYLCKIL